MSITRLQRENLTNLPFYEERVDLAAAFRWTARLNMHEAVANHFSLAVNDDGTHFLMNPNQVHFSRIKASDLLLIDANDPETLVRSQRARPYRLGPARRDAPQRAACALRHACALDPRHRACLARRFEAAADRPELRHLLQPPGGRRQLWRAGLRGGGRTLLASCFADPKVKVMIMGNHGILVIGDTVADAFNRMYYFERAAETYIKALWTGRPLRVLSDEIAEKTAQETGRLSGPGRTAPCRTQGDPRRAGTGLPELSRVGLRFAWRKNGIGSTQTRDHGQ